MARPKWMDDAEKAARSGDFARLEPGGHKCYIKMIEPTKSQSGLDMYIVYFDTTNEDPQPYYFKERYEADKREEKIWGGRMWLVVDETAFNTTKKGTKSYYGQTNLARITTAIEDSAGGNFQTDWNADYRTQEFCRQFAGQKVGIIFREEEYSDPASHELRVSVKAMRFANYKEVLEAKVPNRKELPGSQQAAWVPAQGESGQQGFMQLAIDNLDDLEGLPFNV